MKIRREPSSYVLHEICGELGHVIVRIKGLDFRYEPLIVAANHLGRELSSLRCLVTT